MQNEQSGASRRDFVKASAAAAMVAPIVGLGGAHAAGNETIKIGLIGCGGRGSGAVRNALQADPRTQLVAVADAFEDRPPSKLKGIKNDYKDRVNVDQTTFIGFDGFKKVLALDLDYVILATPPYFRPEHLRAAVEAGKHVFMEKPVAVDPVGARSVMESGEIAKKKGLSIAAGTQRRHEKVYHEAYKQVVDGKIGELVAARCYWNMGQLWFKRRESGQNDMQWMIRDWVNWAWLSGDHITEQHVHNLDVVNWYLTKDGTAAHPIQAVGMGGRARRVTGDQYDYFSIDFEYDNGFHLASYCRQVNGCDRNVSETVIGTKGHTFTHSGGTEVAVGSDVTKFNGRRMKQTNPYVQEHMDLIASIEKKGDYLNEANNVGTSTMTAIMGRIAAYTGRPVTWKEMMETDFSIGPKYGEYNWETACPAAKPPVAGRA